MSDAKETMDLVDEFLQDEVMKRPLPDGSFIVETSFRGNNGGYSVRLAAKDDPLTLFCIVRHPLLVPEPKRVAMAEAVTRANHGLPVGRFDLDMATGDLHLQAAIPLEGAMLTCDQLMTTLAAAMSASDVYHRAFARLTYGDDLSPAECIAEVEMR